jgi:DHA1 family inner membrane transport protein
VSAPTSNSSKLPFVVFLLTLGTFLMNTTEFMIAGVLPEMAADFHVSLSATALLITAFAVGMIVGAPVMVVATLRLPRRVTLVLALAVFAVGHVIAALSSNFEVVLGARVLTALVTGMFWSVAAVVATTAAGPAAASKALGVLMSGTGLATIVGVPLGTLAGQLFGWRGSFWALTVLAVLAAVVMARFVPAEERPQAPRIQSEIAALRNGRLWLILGAAVPVTGGWIAAFSFISPLLTDHAGIPAALVPLVLVGFGAGSLAGTNVSGRFADRNPVGTFIAAAILCTLVLLGLGTLASSPVLAIILSVLLGVAGMSLPPVVTGLAVRYASSAPTLAAALSVSAFNPRHRPRRLGGGSCPGVLPRRDRPGPHRGGRRRARTGADTGARADNQADDPRTEDRRHTPSRERRERTPARSALTPIPFRAHQDPQRGVPPCEQPSCTAPATSASRTSPTPSSSSRPTRWFAWPLPASAAVTCGPTTRCPPLTGRRGWATSSSA